MICFGSHERLVIKIVEFSASNQQNKIIICNIVSGKYFAKIVGVGLVGLGPRCIILCLPYPLVIFATVFEFCMKNRT